VHANGGTEVSIGLTSGVSKELLEGLDLSSAVSWACSLGHAELGSILAIDSDETASFLGNGTGVFVTACFQTGKTSVGLQVGNVSIYNWLLGGIVLEVGPLLGSSLDSWSGFLGSSKWWWLDWFFSSSVCFLHN